ncbi:PRC-barrel domain-containing protein [Jatrophihabitans sp. YIM 134969]
MTSFSDANGRKVVSTSSAETVGKVDGFVVDPVTRSVVALEIKKAESGDVLLWRDIAGFGEDAVTVADAGAIIDAPPEIDALQGKDHELKGKRVLTVTGVDLGKVKDVDFDAQTGALTMLTLKGHEIHGSALTGVGSYAVVVQA